MKRHPPSGGTLSPDLRQKIERLLELQDAHMAAIQGKRGAQKFYTNGEHDELVELISPVYAVLGIRPWQDAEPLLRAALEE